MTEIDDTEVGMFHPKSGAVFNCKWCGCNKYYSLKRDSVTAVTVVLKPFYARLRAIRVVRKNNIFKTLIVCKVPSQLSRCHTLESDIFVLLEVSYDFLFAAIFAPDNSTT